MALRLLSSLVRTGCIVLLVLAVGAGDAVLRSPAVDAEDDGASRPSGVLVTLQTEAAVDSGPAVTLSPEVAALHAESSTLRASQERLDALVAEHDRTVADLNHERDVLAGEEAEQVAVGATIDRRTAQVEKASLLAERTRSTLSALGVQRFVVGDHLLEGLDPSLDSERAQELNRMKVLGDVGTAHVLAQHRYTEDRAAAISAQLERLGERQDELVRLSRERGARIERLQVRAAGLESGVAAATRERDRARLGATIAGTDLSTVALDAYWRAAASRAATDPGCGITWSVLAGIGRTETQHGTYRGSSIDVDGVVRPPIFGPDLDGSNAFAIVRDSDAGRLDGTASTDRAVGPMQFLPGTWRAVGQDADFDGVADPNDIYDAASSAAEYLCRSGPGLGEASRLRAAVLTYNRSQEYADLVVERAAAYADQVPLS